MPKQFLQLSNFSGGLNTKFDARDINDDEITNVSNLHVYKSGQLFSSTASATVTSRGAGSLVSGYGMFLFKSDNDISSANKTIDLLALADVADSSVDFIEDPFGSPDNTNHLAEIDIGTETSNGNFVYYYVDGALRVCDSYTSGTTTNESNRCYWYGHVDKVGTIPGGAVDGWIKKTNNLAAPTATNITADGAARYATAGHGFDVDITVEATDDDGLWEATAYEFAQSFVYEGNQESLLTAYPESVTLPTNNYFAGIIVGITNSGAQFSDRIKGGRVYIRKKDSNDLWTLFLDMDFERGVRKDVGDKFSVWASNVSGAGTDKWRNTDAIEIKGPSIDTYESLNGYSPDVGHLSFGEEDGLFYKDVTVCNQRTFVAHVNYYTPVGGAETKLMPDRILYTPIGRYDTFPPNQFIDIGINDGEDFTALESFGTKLLAFKQGTLYIIDVTSPNDMEWALESTHNGLGVDKPSAVVKTEFGICWARKTGIYAWSPSQGIVELSSKLDKNTAPMTGLASPVVGYYPPDSQLLVVQDCTQSSDALVYDFATKSFTELGTYTGAAITNMQNNQDNCIWLEGNNVKKYSSAQGSTSWILETKDFDFGNPALLKRPLKLVVSYSTSSGVTVTTNIYKDGDGTPDGLDSSTWATAANSGIKVISLTGIGTVSSLKFKFSANGNYQINDMTIVYRTTRKNPSTGVN